MIIQPSTICDLLKITDVEQVNSVLSTIMSLLLYMESGDRIETSSINIEKIGDSLLHIDSEVSATEIVTSMDKYRIIKLPI